MFALVILICYLDGGCDELVVDIFHTQLQCERALYSQQIRHGGCFPLEDYADSFWQPAQHVVTSYPTLTADTRLPAPVHIVQESVSRHEMPSLQNNQRHSQQHTFINK